MRQQWEEQPTTNEMQKVAVKLNLAMLDRDFASAKSYAEEIKKHFGDTQ